MSGKSARILTVFGTRPEAIKLAPLIGLLAGQREVESRVCVSAQHREMLDSVLALFHIRPAYDLDVMRPDQSLSYLTAAVLQGLDPVLADSRPDALVVQGDTTTTFAAALAAFYRRVPTYHVEAGLRTGNLDAPWPEEANRRFTSVITRRHFAPTARAKESLLREGVEEARVLVTGNTVIDALLDVAGRLERNPGLERGLARRFAFLDPGKRLVLLTCHRRENFDGGLDRIFAAIGELAARGDVEIVYPVHLNPTVQAAARRRLAGRNAVHLVDPQDYLPFVYLMRRCHLILTDSGGIQEEAPSLGKPVLVLREVTERPEAVEAGTVRVVGTDTGRILAEATRLLDSPEAYAAMTAAHNPYGDGRASERIVAALLRDLGIGEVEAPAPFVASSRPARVAAGRSAARSA